MMKNIEKAVKKAIEEANWSVGYRYEVTNMGESGILVLVKGDYDTILEAKYVDADMDAYSNRAVDRYYSSKNLTLIIEKIHEPVKMLSYIDERSDFYHYSKSYEVDGIGLHLPTYISHSVSGTKESYTHNEGLLILEGPPYIYWRGGGESGYEDHGSSRMEVIIEAPDFGTRTFTWDNSWWTEPEYECDEEGCYEVGDEVVSNCLRSPEVLQFLEELEKKYPHLLDRPGYHHIKDRIMAWENDPCED